MHIRRRAVTWTLTVSIIAIVATALAWPKAVDVEVGRAAVGPLRVTIDADARTRVRHRFVVTAPVAGQLRRVSLRAGDSVRAGEVLARIAPLPLDSAAVSAARARVDAASASVDDATARLRQASLSSELASRATSRYRALEDVGGVSRQQREQAELESTGRAQELVAAQARLRTAVAELAAARAALPDAPSNVVSIRAPTSGRVLLVLEESERVLSAGTPLLELGRDADLEIVADVLSADALSVPRNARVDLVIDDGAHAIHGIVRYVEPAARTRLSALGVEEQRVNVVITPLTPVAGLGDGFHLDAHIVVWEARVLHVPPSALVTDGTGSSVFIVTDGEARVRRVRVGHQSDEAAEIRSGLSDGDRVILFPSDRIRNGTRVSFRAPVPTSGGF